MCKQLTLRINWLGLNSALWTPDQPTNCLLCLQNMYFLWPSMTKTFCQQILKSKSENFGWALHLDSGRQECAHQENVENFTQYCILCPKKLRTGVIRLRTRASWLAPELFLLHLQLSSTIYYYLQLSTTIYYYLLYLYLPVRPGERSAKRRSGSSSTSSSGWSRWQLCYSATKQLCHSATLSFHEMSFAFLENLWAIYLILFPAVVRSDCHQCVL